MILKEIKQYLRQRRHSTLLELSRQFDIEPDALRGMLGQWVRKGKVRRVDVTPKCQSTCGKCGSIELEFYEWVDSAKALRIAEKLDHQVL